MKSQLLSCVGILACIKYVFGGSCVVDPYLTDIPLSMDQAIDLITDVVAAYPSPCQSRASFCSPLINLNATRADLLQASQLFALAFSNYTAIIKDNQALTCNVLQPSCSCRVIQDQLEILLESYKDEYDRGWAIFNQSSPDCETQAKFLRGLVNQYYCIAEDLYRDLGECQVVCNRDWCDFYNCSSRPCPPNPPINCCANITLNTESTTPLDFLRRLRMMREE